MAFKMKYTGSSPYPKSALKQTGKRAETVGPEAPTQMKSSPAKIGIKDTRKLREELRAKERSKGNTWKKIRRGMGTENFKTKLAAHDALSGRSEEKPSSASPAKYTGEFSCSW